MNKRLRELKRRSQEINLKLAESALDIFSGYGLFSGNDFYGGYGDGWGWGGTTTIPPLWAQSQKRGEVIPVYLNETQLRRIRDRSRRLCQESGFAICAVENLKNYVVGKGLIYRAVSIRPEADAQAMAALVAQVNKIIELFRHANNLAAWEADSVLRAVRDGDVLIRCFEAPSGLLLLRPVEAEHLRSPVGDSFGPEYTFGVQTAADDIMSIEGYWIVEQPILSPLPRFVPADEIVHIKWNTDLSAKRGLPLFYPIEGNFRRAEDLLTSMTSLAKQRAKIAMIRKMKGMAQSAAQNLSNSLVDFSVTDPSTGNQVNFERMKPGTILTSPDGIEYEYPSADVQASDYVAILECELRSICARMNWPDWMLTSNAGAASFASGLIAEAPSTRMFERWQSTFSQFFGECSFPGRESLIWRQLRIAIRRGVLPANLDELIEIQVECPTLVVRDKAQEATVNQTYLETKIKSPQTVQQEQGLDSEQEARNWAEWEASHPQQQPALPGMPGMPAQPPAAGQPNPGEQRPPGPGGPAKAEGLRESEEPSHGHDEDNIDNAAPLIADILYELFGKDALKHLDSANITEAWNRDDHPRGKGGRFIPKGSAEAVAAAKEVVGKALKGHGDPVEVAHHLAILTVAQLRQLHKENGTPKIPSQILREHLVQAVKDKLTPASAPAKKEEPKAAEPKPKAEPAAKEDHHPAVAKLHDALAKSSIPEEKRKTYTEAIKRVTAHMPESALDKIHSNLKQANFHPDTKSIGMAAVDDALKTPGIKPEQKEFWEGVRKHIEAGEMQPGGAFTNGQLHVDGDYDYGSQMLGNHSTGDKALTHEVYAHELGHAIDGSDKALSSTPEWGEAFSQEIAHNPWIHGTETPQLSEYGGQNSTEGFAEFARLLYGSDVPATQIEEEFPKASEFFKSKGLWPEGKAGVGSAMPEVFDKRVQLPGEESSHIDTLKGESTEPPKDYSPNTMPQNADGSYQPISKEKLAAHDKSWHDSEKKIADRAVPPHIEASTINAAKEIRDEPKNKRELGGLIKVPDLWDKVHAAHPDLSREDFDLNLRAMQAQDKMTLQKVNDPRLEPRQGEMISSPRGLLGYVRIRDESSASKEDKAALLKEKGSNGLGFLSKKK